MPYIITTYPEPTMAPGFVGTRRAVATLEEARTEVYHHVATALPDDARRREDMQPITEDGGTIGPLPNGTVIEVRPITLYGLAENAGRRGWQLARITARPDLTNPAEIIDAYNAEGAR